MPFKVAKGFTFKNTIRALAVQPQGSRVAGLGLWNRSQKDSIFRPKIITLSISGIITTAAEGRSRGNPNLAEEGILLYSDSYAYFLQRCIDAKSLAAGKRIHGHMIKFGFKRSIFLWNRLVDLYGYANNGCIDNPRVLFDKMPERDRVSWNSMVAGYAKHGHGMEALELFCQMKLASVRPDHFTFVVVVSACTSLTNLEAGKQIHTHVLETGIESNVFVGNALIDMYAKCGTIEEACQVFDKMSETDGVSVNAMIGGYACHGHAEKALRLHSQMHREGVKSTEASFANIVSACASFSAWEQGKQIHTNIVKTGFESSTVVGDALVDMYRKCEAIDDTHHLFHKMFERDVVSWNVMTVRYALFGLEEMAINYYL